MEYGSLALFYDITDQEVEAMIQCFRMRRCRFHPGQIICTYGESAGEVGVLVSGEAELVRLDYAGNRTILERLETGGVFGESLAFTPTLGDCVEVVSAAGSEVLFMEYSHIMKRCENACAHHSKLVQNMFRLVAEQTRRLSRRVCSVTSWNIFWTSLLWWAQAFSQRFIRWPYSINSASLSPPLTTSTQSPSSGVKARTSPKTPPVPICSRMVRVPA